MNVLNRIIDYFQAKGSLLLRVLNSGINILITGPALLAGAFFVGVMMLSAGGLSGAVLRVHEIQARAYHSAPEGHVMRCSRVENLSGSEECVRQPLSLNDAARIDTRLITRVWLALITLSSVLEVIRLYVRLTAHHVDKDKR